MTPTRRDEETTRAAAAEDLPDLVRGLLTDAVRKNATDIHIDPVSRSGYRICFRVDGEIHPQKRLPDERGEALVNQIKVASRSSPEALFAPLEGRLGLRLEDRKKDVRVTLIPASRREAAHLRLLSPPEQILEPAALGLTEDSYERIRSVLKTPEGLILITGPTGAGKTMTLYSLTSLLDLESTIAVSIEDPVEYDMPFARQVQVDTRHDLTMHEGLRSLLRMDPDIILIGEIRDARSAQAAARAAATGRFVLATMHARDVAMAIEACRHLSIPSHLLGSTLRLVVAQNLVRRLCTNCTDRRKTTKEDAALFEAEGLDVPEEVHEPVGCDACHGFGYRGRIGIFEVVPIDRELGQAISDGHGADAMRARQNERRDASLRADALRKVADGITSLGEVRDLHFPGGDEEVRTEPSP